jgi:hypothetical protein
MARTGASYGFPEGRVAPFDRQVFDPVLPVGVADDDSDWRADCFRMPDAGNDVSAIRLDLHSPAAAKALLTAPKLVIDTVQRDWNSRWKPRQRCHKTLAMGLAGGFEP